MLTSSPAPADRWRSDAQPELAALPVGVIGGRPVLVDVVVFGVEGAFRIGYRLFEIDEVRFARRRRFLGLIEFRGLGGIKAKRRLAPFIGFQERIALELLLHVLRQLDVGQLKQTDGLLQLGCHHQLLALSQLQLCRKRHALVQVSRLLMRVVSSARVNEHVSEVHTPHVVVGYDFLRLTLCQNLTVIDDVSPIYQAKGFADVMIGDEHADAPLRQVPHQLLNIADGDRVDAGEGFVQQHE